MHVDRTEGVGETVAHSSQFMMDHEESVKIRNHLEKVSLSMLVNI